MARAVSDLDEEIYGPGGPHQVQRGLPLVRVVAGKAPPTHPSALYRVSEPWTEAEIPCRPWVAPGYLLRGSVTVLAGPGSAGKSSLVVAWTTAHALGEEFGRFRSYNREPLKCLSYNVEDDADELRRRYSAMGRRFNANPSDILANLTLVGPTDVGTLLYFDRMGGLLVNTRAMDELETIIGDTKPDSVWLDPFVELHEAEENDNTAVRAVMARLRQVAKTHATGLGVLAHTRKGIATPGDPDQIRGASSIVGAGRICLTVNVMTKEEAEKLGIPEDTRRDFFRVDDAKKNYSRIQDAEWFERVEYTLDNGDHVAVPNPWCPPTIAMDQGDISRLIDLIAKGSPVGPYSPRLSKDPRSIATAMASMGIDGKAAQTQALAQIRATGQVEVAHFKMAKRSRENSPTGMRTTDRQPSSVEWWDHE